MEKRLQQQKVSLVAVESFPGISEFAVKVENRKKVGYFALLVEKKKKTKKQEKIRVVELPFLRLWKK